MKCDLKNFPDEEDYETHEDWDIAVQEWFEGFEAELREKQQKYDPKKCYLLCLNHCPILNQIFDQGLEKDDEEIE